MADGPIVLCVSDVLKEYGEDAVRLLQGTPYNFCFEDVPEVHVLTDDEMQKLAGQVPVFSLLWCIIVWWCYPQKDVFEAISDMGIVLTPEQRLGYQSGFVLYGECEKCGATSELMRCTDLKSNTLEFQCIDCNVVSVVAKQNVHDGECGWNGCDIANVEKCHTCGKDYCEKHRSYYDLEEEMNVCYECYCASLEIVPESKCDSSKSRKRMRASKDVGVHKRLRELRASSQK